MQGAISRKILPIICVIVLLSGHIVLAQAPEDRTRPLIISNMKDISRAIINCPKPPPEVSHISINGISYPYIKKLSVSATAYTENLEDPEVVAKYPYFGFAASGGKLAVGQIAVDRKIIPLGSRVYVIGHDSHGKKYTGIYVATDTGSAIKNNKIDIYMDSLAEVRQFGRRKMTVYLLGE